MTQGEKTSPEIIKKTRKRRIAIGSGVSYAIINKMLDQYNSMKKMMKRFLQMSQKAKKGGMPPIPGLGKGAEQMMKKMGKDFKF
jgi:signal recognition particle subunit SRP54